MIQGIKTRLFPILLRPSLKRKETERLGSDYGGWHIPKNTIQENWTIYSGGVGEDTTFDEELIKKYNCHVHAFDPTPRAKKHVEKQNIPNFHFHNYGLWSEEKELKFYAPKDPKHVSHSILNLQQTNDYFTAKVKRIKDIMEELQHTKLDLLKIDVEGAEHEVINSLLEDNVLPKVLCTEFDQPSSLLKILRTIKKLKKHNYQLIKVEGWNCTFLLHKS